MVPHFIEVVALSVYIKVTQRQLQVTLHFYHIFAHKTLAHEC